jgi:hypothetical protein
MLAELVAGAMRMRWEALIAAKPNKFVLRLCHDDYLTVYARSTPSGIIHDLEKLGLPAQRTGIG